MTMNLKSRLQRMLQVVEDAERVGALDSIERDILLNELREAYAELKFGEIDLAEPKAEKVELPVAPVAPIAECDDEDDEESEVEVELIFDESDDEEIETEETETAEAEETVAEEPQPIVEEPQPIVEEKAEPISTPHRSAVQALYEENPAPVVGEQFHETPVVADTITCPKGVAENTPIVSLHSAIGLADKFLLIHELFGGDSEAYDKAINALEEQPSFDDSVIYISEHFNWSPRSESTKLIMELLQRKYNA